MALGSGNYKPSMSIPGWVPEQKETLTLAATTFHSPMANVAFAHSLNNGVGVHESKVVDTSLYWTVFEATSPSLALSGVERYMWVKSVEKFRTHDNQTG